MLICNYCLETYPFPFSTVNKNLSKNIHRISSFNNQEQTWSSFLKNYKYIEKATYFLNILNASTSTEVVLWRFILILFRSLLRRKTFQNAFYNKPINTEMSLNDTTSLRTKYHQIKKTEIPFLFGNLNEANNYVAFVIQADNYFHLPFSPVFIFNFECYLLRNWVAFWKSDVTSKWVIYTWTTWFNIHANQSVQL